MTENTNETLSYVKYERLLAIFQKMNVIEITRVSNCNVRPSLGIEEHSRHARISFCGPAASARLPLDYEELFFIKRALFLAMKNATDKDMEMGFETVEKDGVA